MIPLYDTSFDAKENATIGFPSHVKVEKILLFSSVDKKTGIRYASDETEYDQEIGYNISESVSELSFVESMFSIAVSGTITIIDNFSFFQDARIHGQEMLFMKFRRFSPETQSYDFAFVREFYVTSVMRYERDEFHSTFTLEFVSPHAISDKFKRISRAYGYTDSITFHPSDISGGAEKFQAWEQKYKEITIDYHDPGLLIGAPADFGQTYEGVLKFPMEMPEQFVYHILTNDLSIPKDRVFLYGYHPEDAGSDDHSQKRMKLIVPGWRPIQTIRWLMRNIYSNTGDPWFCYETFWGGFRIEPYRTLIAHDDELNDGEKWSTGRPTKVLDHTYIYNHLFVPVPGTSEYFVDVHRKVHNLNIGYSFDQFLKLGNGAYSSYEWFVDIASKFMIPNDLIPIEKTHLRYDDTIDEKSWMRDQFRPFTNEVEKVNPPQHAPDFQQTNYTYYVPYNTALHGTTEETYPYNSAFGLNELNAATIQIPGADRPPTPPGDPNVDPNSDCPFTRSNFNKNDPKWHAYLLSLEKQHGMPCGLMWAKMMTESGGNPNARSGAGAEGLFQFMPGTAEEFGINAYDPCSAAKASAQYLSNIRRQLKTDSWQIAAYGYNWGPNRDTLRKMARGEIPMGTGLPDETRNHWIRMQKFQSQAPYCSGAPKALEEDETPKTSEVGRVDTQATISYSLEIKGIDLGKYGRTGEMKKKNLDFIQHQMTVYGDFRLNPGAIVNLSVQRTVDPILVDKIEGLRDTEPVEDKYISGAYFIVDAKHIFNKDGFHTTATLSRPSSTLDLT
jgi:hypothetical protein